MKKKLIILMTAVLMIMLLCPYKIRMDKIETKYADWPDHQVKALLWEYTYTSYGPHNDGLGYGGEGSYAVTKSVTIFFGKITVYKDSESMMSAPDRQIVPAERRTAVSYIPAT